MVSVFRSAVCELSPMDQPRQRWKKGTGGLQAVDRSTAQKRGETIVEMQSAEIAKSVQMGEL